MRRNTTVAVMLLWLVGCGGGTSTKTATKSKTKASALEEDPEPEAREPEKKPQRSKTTYAKAALTPVKGSRLEPILISFTQRGREDATVEADSFNGAKPGTYWLVIHDGTSCGANASKAGPVWAGTDVTMRVVIRRDFSGGLEDDEVPISLNGDTGAIGHALVLHVDKKGKPGKALACGIIEEVDEP